MESRNEWHVMVKIRPTIGDWFYMAFNSEGSFKDTKETWEKRVEKRISENIKTCDSYEIVGLYPRPNIKFVKD